MRIIVAGDWHSDLHEEAVLNAFGSLGHDARRFSWHQYFAGAGKVSRFCGRVQNRLIAGPLLSRLNRDFERLALESNPELIFVYRGTHILRGTLERIKRELPACSLLGYNNDDPFARSQSRLLWRHFLTAVPAYDLMLAYRRHNIEEFRRAGARRVELLRSWFIPERNRPVPLTQEETERFGCDVVFIGHFEADGREKALDTVAADPSIRFRLFGPEWEGVAERLPNLARFAPVRPVRGEEYNKALCAAKISLCFLSKLNRDTYTRRCFEIPAAGGMLLAEYSDDLATLFREGVEAEFFRDPKELHDKILYYLAHEAKRASIAAGGRRRVLADGHDVVSRMRQLLDHI